MGSCIAESHINYQEMLASRCDHWSPAHTLCPVFLCIRSIYVTLHIEILWVLRHPKSSVPVLVGALWTAGVFSITSLLSTMSSDTGTFRKPWQQAGSFQTIPSSDTAHAVAPARSRASLPLHCGCHVAAYFLCCFFKDRVVVRKHWKQAKTGRQTKKGRHAKKNRQERKNRKKSWIKVRAHTCKIVPLPDCHTKCTLGDPTGWNKLLKRQRNIKKFSGPLLILLCILCVCVWARLIVFRMY